MSHSTAPATVEVHELVAWGLDDYPYRDLAAARDQSAFATALRTAHQQIAVREPYVDGRVLHTDHKQHLHHLLDLASQREDLHEEYREHAWSIDVVDLRCLLAFQRRLVFRPSRHLQPVPPQQDWPGLIALTLGMKRDIDYRLEQTASTPDAMEITLHSSNPDLQLRLNRKIGCVDSLRFTLHGGCPFLEVAELHGRWFLRDGYHRAYRLLQAGVACVPAVLLRVKTLEELGATQPWFFSEEQLFSNRPPRVQDFLDEQITFRYQRKALGKVIRIRIEETLEELDQNEREAL